ncbi:MAG TPA: cbb3-type cytochrome c oxidase subunit I [Gemmatimonadales bacterium]|jgi:cbb3-type cytochrome oxidase subunit 1
MEWFVKAFVQSSLAWLGLGVTLGVAMAVHPAWAVYRTAHMHMNLLGFVAMMIQGVAYHVIPRFAGRRLYSNRIAGVQWWLSNLGLAGMVVGFIWRTRGWDVGNAILAVGGSLAAVGSYLFIYNIWRSMAGPAPVRPSPLPTA